MEMTFVIHILASLKNIKNVITFIVRITPKLLHHAGGHDFFSIIYGEKRAGMPGNPIRTVKYNEFPKV